MLILTFLNWILLTYVRDELLFLTRSGLVIIWKLPMYYKSFRSRIMFEKILWSNKELNQKKFFEKTFDEYDEFYYNLDFNNKISKIVIKMTKYYFTLRLLSKFLYNSELKYEFEFNKYKLLFFISENISIHFSFNKYTEYISLLDPFDITEKFKYYVIDTKNKYLTNIFVNNPNFNIQNEGKIEVFIYRNIYIYENKFEFIIVTKDIIIFLKVNSTVLYVYENNIPFNLYLSEFRSGFELFLRNNSFNFYNQ